MKICFLGADNDVVDGNVDQLDEEADEAHDGEPDCCGDRDLNPPIKLNTINMIKMTWLLQRKKFGES